MSEDNRHETTWIDEEREHDPTFQGVLTDEVRERGIRKLVAAAQVPEDLPTQPTLVFLLRLLDKTRATLRERDAKLEQAEAEVTKLHKKIQQVADLGDLVNDALLERDRLRGEVDVARTNLLRWGFVNFWKLVGWCAMWPEGTDPLTQWKLAVKERDALVVAIQRGYCPEESCYYGRTRMGYRTIVHNPDCRVAPLLGGGR